VLQVEPKNENDSAANSQAVREREAVEIIQLRVRLRGVPEEGAYDGYDAAGAVVRV